MNQQHDRPPSSPANENVRSGRTMNCLRLEVGRQRWLAMTFHCNHDAEHCCKSTTFHECLQRLPERDSFESQKSRLWSCKPMGSFSVRTRRAYSPLESQIGQDLALCV